MRVTMNIMAAVVGGLLGLIASYGIGAEVACRMIHNPSNLCGLPSALIIAPLGAVIGAGIGWKIGCRVTRGRGQPTNRQIR